ncbi:7808_t:CDS:2 [Diversispora eburnea]|uniref:7808_t:CDS:1 n=1 Tax=Diversispora eburnea TaxID=1213867 RepID=A0A9N8V2Z8_9GLOM|nr:7808_t:CDS:2 [Diversispora eburnea]
MNNTFRFFTINVRNIRNGISSSIRSPSNMIVRRLASVNNATSQEVPTKAPSEVSAAEMYAIGNRVRNDWTIQEIQSIYDSPIMSLLYFGAKVHREYHDPLAVQQCTLLSIKTGGCSEDCSYCPQSSKYKTIVKATKLLDTDEVLIAAKKAKEVGTAWRDLSGRKSNFNKILGYVKEIRSMGMEVCCTLGMLDEAQAKALKEAGLTAYNHNLDTSREFYPKPEDRVGMLHTLATLPHHPESVPINALVQVEGTPLAKQEPVSIWEMIRMISTGRIIMPKAMIRLSAGRIRFSHAEQALCFMAGANSIFTGDKLLTTENNDFNEDQEMFKILGLIPKEANFNQGTPEMKDDNINNNFIPKTL